MSVFKLKHLISCVDFQLLLYILAIAESLLYGLVILTYVGALIAFRNAEKRHDDEDFELSKLLEVEAMIQIFGIAIFFVVSIVAISGVKENDSNKLLPYILLCVTQILAVIIYSIFIWTSWVCVAFVTLKLIMFILSSILFSTLSRKRHLNDPLDDIANGDSNAMGKSSKV